MKIQFLQVNDLFDKDLFLEAIYQKQVSIFCSSIANQHHEDFVSPGGCHNTMRLCILTEQR